MQSILCGTVASRSPPPEIREAKEHLTLPSTRRDIPTHLSNDEDERVNVAVIPLESQAKMATSASAQQRKSWPVYRPKAWSNTGPPSDKDPP